MKISAIINPLASAGKAYRLLPYLKKITSDSNHRFEWQIINSKEKMGSAILSAKSRGYDTVLIAGGDGTLSNALPYIIKSNLPLCYLPCGRGNDFARNVGIPLDIKKALNYPDEPKIKWVDLPTVNEVPFGSTAYIGVDTKVTELANKPNRLFKGKIGYNFYVLKALFNFEPFEIEIKTDNDIWRGRIMMVVIANGSDYGGGMKIAPDAVIDDGILNLCIVKETSKLKLIRQFPKVFSGKHITDPNVILKSGKQITIKANRHYKVFADGEYIEDLPVTITIKQQSLPVILPKLID
jgi:YegS/Rv2252/BmrU family lipid kinase